MIQLPFQIHNRWPLAFSKRILIGQVQNVIVENNFQVKSTEDENKEDAVEGCDKGTIDFDCVVVCRFRARNNN